MAKRQNDSRWLIQIGADRSAATLQARAHARGLSSLVFDPDADAPAARHATRQLSRTPEDFAGMRDDVRAILRGGEIVGCSIHRPTNAATRTAARLRDEFALPGLSADSAETLLDRSAWKKVLIDHAIPTPVSAILDSPDELDRFLGAQPSALLKPATGGRGSVGVSRVRIGDPRNRDLFDEARLASDSELVRAESFVSGDEYGIEGFVHAGVFQPLQLGRKFSMRNLRGTLPTGRAWGSPRAGASADSEPLWAKSAETAQQISSAFGLEDGFLSLDLLDDGERLHVIDFRPRLGLGVARGLEFAGFDLASLELDLATGECRREEIAADRELTSRDRGYALRFFYSNAQGSLERLVEGTDEPTASDADTGSPGWQVIPLESARVRIEWEKRDGEILERRRSTDDVVACAWVEAEDRDAAWMGANEIDADSIFRVVEPGPDPTLNQPVWPVVPPQAPTRGSTEGSSDA